MMRMITQLGVGLSSTGSSSLNIMLMKGWGKLYPDLCPVCRLGWRVAIGYHLGRENHSNKTITDTTTTTNFNEKKTKTQP